MPTCYRDQQLQAISGNRLSDPARVAVTKQVSDGFRVAVDAEGVPIDRSARLDLYFLYIGLFGCELEG